MRLFGALAMVILAGLGTAFPVTAFAQIQNEDRLEFPEWMLRPTRTPGQNNEIAFCINSTSILADFDRDLAREVAATLLQTPRFVEVTVTMPPSPYDFRVPLTEQEVYVRLLHECDAFVGFTLAADYPEWLRPSTTYLETNTVLATPSAGYESLNDIPRDVVIGVRILSLAANSFTTYLRTLPQNNRWSFLLYPNHGFTLDRLMDGSVGAILMWEPALLRYLAEHPEAPEIHILRELPFTVVPTRFVMALRPDEDYFNALLNDAINAIVEDGIAERLAIEHGILQSRS